MEGVQPVGDATPRMVSILHTIMDEEIRKAGRALSDTPVNGPRRSMRALAASQGQTVRRCNGVQHRVPEAQRAGVWRIARRRRCGPYDHCRRDDLAAGLEGRVRLSSNSSIMRRRLGGPTFYHWALPFFALTHETTF